MRRPRLDEDVQPVSEFRANAAKFVRQVRETRRPLLLTQHGQGAAVLLGVEEYERMAETIERLRIGTPHPGGWTMPDTYRAILTGDHLDWLGEKPSRSEATPVEVIVQESPPLGAARSDGARMAEALEDLGGLGVYRRFDDPVRWQRMVREERPLPGRD